MSYTEKEVFERVRDCFIEALGVDEEEVEMSAKVIDDLGAESLDFLDIVFRLERSFKIKIPRGDLENKVQSSMGDQEYEVDGVLTAVAIENLRTVMPEVPAQETANGLMTKDIPKLFRVATFHNICVKLLEEKGEMTAA